jgi:dynein heavy chain 1, cytosolic
MQTFRMLEKQTGDNQDPLYRLFAREGGIGNRLLKQVKKDLADVVQVCEGQLKQTNHLRTLMSSLTKGRSNTGYHHKPVQSNFVSRHHPRPLASV